MKRRNLAVLVTGATLLIGCSGPLGSQPKSAPAVTQPETVSGATQPKPTNEETQPKPTNEATQPASGTVSEPAAEPGPSNSATPGQAPSDSATSPAPPPSPPKRQHVDVRGLYMTGITAGIDSWLQEMVAFAKAKNLNAFVIDAMDDDGRISWQTDIPLAMEIGSNSNKIKDPKQVVRYLEENGIYPIARLVVYADPLLGARRPDLSIKRPDGTQFVDTRNIRWPDPYNRKVWEYKVAVAKSAVAMGFKEIQFDYIRFPEHRIAGFNYQVPVHQRAQAIEDFLRYAKAELEPLGVYISADVFGLTTSVAMGDDMEIGQVYEELIQVVDYIKPMVYPSHYAPHTYGVADPNADPGRVVYESMVRAQKRTWGEPVEKHRPWIQDFTYGKKYVAADIEAQILGLARAGIHQWILWDPGVRYTRDVNFDVGKSLIGQEPEWRRTYRAELERQEREAVEQMRTELEQMRLQGGSVPE